ncbi:MAG: bifunctional UDP-N-acetylglucosamine diphosphorylase/glucosamine-1-phosphate N-acetyltransferase GlmU [Actinomycetota bacterium]|nr:bifunctional UDP-N-acetylglucosamine diphosphorylase/glucosamine-1-phosphate N-acetyltransferase GlmU [Actinomycetota bacterium]
MDQRLEWEVAEAMSGTVGIVLAAGAGKRMHSELPKVLHEVAGRPLVAHVLAALEPIALDDRVVVCSDDVDDIATSCARAGFAEGISFVVQEKPRGTADALKVGLAGLENVPETVLVMNGATPLVRTETLARLLSMHRERGAAATLLTAELMDPAPYGRIVRGFGDEVEKIVEERDATDLERSITEVNAGVYVFSYAAVNRYAGEVDRANAQGEYYITDIIGMLRSAGEQVEAFRTDPNEIKGVKSRVQLAEVGELMRARIAARWMGEGVTIVDPRTTYIDATVTIESDVLIQPFSFLEGATSVGRGVEVGPQARVMNSVLGEDSVVSYAVIRDSELGPRTSVGPFASLRPGTKLGAGAHLGSFVETKNTTVGENSKVPHLSYLGDADIGRGVNVGAGSITGNWDGRGKHKTVIEDDAYISSNTTMVAPVRIGKGAATGAGAVVRQDVPPEALAVGVPARVIEGKGNKMAKEA